MEIKGSKPFRGTTFFLTATNWLFSASGAPLKVTVKQVSDPHLPIRKPRGCLGPDQVEHEGVLELNIPIVGVHSEDERWCPKHVSRVVGSGVESI